MRILKFKDFMKKKNLKDDNMKGSQLQEVSSNPKYPKDSNIQSEKGFVNIDGGSMIGTHWTCFMIKDNKSL